MPASFLYDSLGRRQRKTVNGTLTDFMYDGLNPVREASGARTVDLLAGLGIDEYFTRVDSTASRDVLADTLGSTVGLADSGGTVQTEYSYEPFDAVEATGSNNGNELRYTGREDDGTPLYYYLARYYHTDLQRFVGGDPIRFEGGDVNLYAYVANNTCSMDRSSGSPYRQRVRETEHRRVWLRRRRRNVYQSWVRQEARIYSIPFRDRRCRRICRAWWCGRGQCGRFECADRL
jgi:RHS repeat-associated protein